MLLRGDTIRAKRVIVKPKQHLWPHHVLQRRGQLILRHGPLPHILLCHEQPQVLQSTRDGQPRTLSTAARSRKVVETMQLQQEQEEKDQLQQGQGG